MNATGSQQFGMHTGGSLPSLPSLPHNASQMNASYGPGGGVVALPGMMASQSQGNIQHGGGVLALQQSNASGLPAGGLHPSNQLALQQHQQQQQHRRQSNATMASEQEGSLHIKPQKAPTYDPQRKREEELKEAMMRRKPLDAEDRKKGRLRNQQVTKEFDKVLKKNWNVKQVLTSLDTQIESYANRHGSEKKLKAERGVKEDPALMRRQKELVLLDKMKKDEQDGALVLPVEGLAQDAMRSGFREYVDYTVDEVERFNTDVAEVKQKQFDWATCGDAHDVPALRRCHRINRVDGARGHVAGHGHGHDGMFKMDFLRDFCARDYHPKSEAEALQIMAMAKHNLMPGNLHRADNHAVLYSPEEPPEPDCIVTLRPKGHYREMKFGERPWNVEYSVV